MFRQNRQRLLASLARDAQRQPQTPASTALPGLGQLSQHAGRPRNGAYNRLRAAPGNRSTPRCASEPTPARDRQTTLTIIAKRMVCIHSVDFA